MATGEMNELISITRARQKTYSLLSRIFRVEADEALLDELAALDLSATGESKIDEGYSLWRDFLASRDELTLLNLARDYVKVFIGAGRGAQSAAYPFESVYTSKERLMMAEARDEVFAIYAYAGLVKDKDFKAPEDHIALELEFMAYLADKTAAALEAGDEDVAGDIFTQQMNFLSDHLLNWVPYDFTSDILRFAATDLYKGLALVTCGFLATDSEFMSDITAEEESEAMAL